MTTIKALVPLADALAVGCANGFNRDALQERLNDGSFQITDKVIAEARSLKPQLRFPCRIACYLNPTAKGGDWRWTAEDRAAMEPLAAALKKEGIASEVFQLPEMLSGDGKLHELRLAAAKCGADVLFVVNGAAQSDKYKNAAAALNLTLVGGYLVPGSHIDSLFMVEGCLFDVDNGYLYTAVKAEGVGKIVRPTFRIEEKDAIAKAKSQAVLRLNDEILRTMVALSKQPAGVPAPTTPIAPAALPGP